MRKKTFMALGGVLFVTVGIMAALALLLRHEPSFFARQAIATGPVRVQQSREFVKKVSELGNAIEGHYKIWGGDFTEEHFNSYFAQDFLEQGLDRFLPDGVSEPRIVFKDNLVRLGFRYGKKPWTTIVTVDFRLWMAPKESNAVLLQLDGVYAGAIPISARMLNDSIGKVVRDQAGDVEITWYRHHGKMTALLEFGSSQPKPAHQLQQLEVTEGQLTIRGRSLSNLPPKTAEAAALP